jgi:glycosyltransferase involved in cell wall biosynthesis
MRFHRHKRPILWLYNADFAECFAALPAVARIYYGIENYFDRPGTPQAYLSRTRSMMHVADISVAINEECAKPLRTLIPPGRLMIVDNGCDFSEYSTPQLPTPEFAALRRKFSRLAIFTGDIDHRLDLSLLEKLIHRVPNTGLILNGLVRMPPEQANHLTTLLNHPNVFHIDGIKQEHLPSVYQMADLGIVPYHQDRWITESGVPTNLMEMAAAGLPIISTLMHPLLRYTPPFAVIATHDEFLDVFEVTKKTLNLCQQLQELAKANGYDDKFTLIIDRLMQMNAPRWSAPVLSICTHSGRSASPQKLT